VDRPDRGDDLSEGEVASSITGCGLPERADILELIDVEGVQANQIAGSLAWAWRVRP
jgi:hypothetical protein